MKNILIIIPARGGSKGIPRKNVRALNGKPLIGYSIKTALSIDANQDVYVSSEDDEILNISRKQGAKTHKRPSSLSEDAVTLDAVIYNAYQEIQKIEKKIYDFIVTLQPTSPLLRAESLTHALTLMIKEGTIDTVISAINDTHLSWKKEGGQYLPNYTERLNRQYLTPNYKETGGFLITRNSIISENNRIGNNVQLHELDAKEAIDIDNFEDWNICEYYLKRKRIIFLVSGYKEIGLGHIYNTLIIANEILDHELIFFCDRKSELGFQKIKENNYDCLIQQTNSLQQEILGLHPDIIIYDRLDSTHNDVKAFKENQIKLIHFEDLGDGAQLADLVFNAIYPEENVLKNHFFGPSYFCARDEFILSDTIPIKSEVSTVLLAFGGVDPNNLTKKTIQAIAPFCKQSKIHIKVICGFGYNEIDSLKEFTNIEIYQNVANISEFMQSADVVFTSAGRTTYELAILGIPSIVLAQNDREMTHFFATNKFGFLNLGLGASIEKETILDALMTVLPKAKREAMQIKMLHHDLKNGKKRVVAKIKQLINEHEIS